MNTINPNSPGFIYVIKATSWMAQVPDCMHKIGLSIHPDVRLEQLQQGLAPFARLELVFSLPVSNMYQVEQKLHDLFQEENIHNEWFCLEPHKIDAVRALGEQVSAIVRPRVRRATADIKYQVASSTLAVEEPAAYSLPTEFESIILAYIPHARKTVSKKVKELLNLPVVCTGGTFDSPERLWATNPEFKVWAERKLSALGKLPGMNIDRATHALRDYANAKYGWIKVGQQPVAESRNDTIDYDFGE